MLLPITRETVGLLVAERIRSMVSKAVTEAGDALIRTTVSIGLALYPENVGTVGDLQPATSSSQSHSLLLARIALSLRSQIGCQFPIFVLDVVGEPVLEEVHGHDGKDHGASRILLFQFQDLPEEILMKSMVGL